MINVSCNQKSVFQLQDISKAACKQYITLTSGKTFNVHIIKIRIESNQKLVAWHQIKLWNLCQQRCISDCMSISDCVCVCVFRLLQASRRTWNGRMSPGARSRSVKAVTWLELSRSSVWPGSTPCVRRDATTFHRYTPVTWLQTQYILRPSLEFRQELLDLFGQLIPTLN